MARSDDERLSQAAVPRALSVWQNSTQAQPPSSELAWAAIGADAPFVMVSDSVIPFAREVTWKLERYAGCPGSVRVDYVVPGTCNRTAGNGVTVYFALHPCGTTADSSSTLAGRIGLRAEASTLPAVQSASDVNFCPGTYLTWYGSKPPPEYSVEAAMMHSTLDAGTFNMAISIARLLRGLDDLNATVNKMYQLRELMPRVEKHIDEHLELGVTNTNSLQELAGIPAGPHRAGTEAVVA